MQNLLGPNWKSTVAGVLSFLITTLTTVTVFLGANVVMNPNSPKIYLYVTLGLNLALALCRAWVGLLTKDAGTTPAQLPGSTEVIPVASHEIPDNPAATPVPGVDVKKIIALIIACSITLVTTGCPAQQTASALIKIVGSAVGSVVAIEGNTAAAQKIQADSKLAGDIVAAWVPGTPSQQALEALNLLAQDLTLIAPISPTVQALLDLASVTLQEVIQIVESQQGPNPPPQPLTAHAQVHKNVTGQTPAKDKAEFKKKWNAIIANDSSLVSAKIK